MLYNPCAPGTRFGVTADKLPDVLPADIEGFHCHCHCESGSDVFERTLAVIEEKFARWFPQLKWINFGGGHLMTRRDYDVLRLIRLLKDFRSRYPWLKIILEPGSAFAWQTGPLVSRWSTLSRTRASARPSSTSVSPATCPTASKCPTCPRCVGHGDGHPVRGLGRSSCLQAWWKQLPERRLHGSLAVRPRTERGGERHF